MTGFSSKPKKERIFINLTCLLEDDIIDVHIHIHIYIHIYIHMYIYTCIHIMSSSNKIISLINIRSFLGLLLNAYIR